MVLVAVIVGYVLGIAPFVIPKIIEFYKNREKEKVDIEESKEQAEIFDEWLNGPKVNDSNEVNQQDIYDEYITGVESRKGD